MNKDYCKYVDVFYGNGEVDHYAKDGIGSKWFYIKALCGNTVPHPVLPFGKMSVGAYSGGYPTGYGTHYPNSCGGIEKLWDSNKIRGFSHLHQSGVGGIGYYYNYAVTTPFYGDLDNVNKFYDLENESAKPGYYTVTFNDVVCELTVDEATALHRYQFKKDGGRVAVDFSNDGLSKLFDEKFYGTVKKEALEVSDDGMVFFSGIMSGVKLYFCVTLEGENVRSELFDDSEKYGCIFDFDGRDVVVKLSYSTIDFESAKKNVEKAKGFDETSKKAYEIWNNHLGAIDIDADEDFKTKFYSNFYHSIIKPVDMTGEQVLGIKDDLVVDYATFWDMNKTVLPLVFMLYPEMSEKIVKSVVNLSRTLNKIPCSLGMSDIFNCEQQAKMLGIFVLCDAYYMNVKNATKEVICECIKREFEREDFKTFIEKGVFERYTHILDTTDACLDVADIIDDSDLKNKLLELSKNWVNAYDNDGYMSENSPYYEGDKYTYSFRIQKNMEERVKLAGGKEKFAEMLDAFFGFNGESVEQITCMDAYDIIESKQYHRFEGFNNECDMEAPYGYIFADRHDRLCEIIRECVENTFTSGKGGLPGNNDSGGLSSCFMWNALGLFPASGTGEFLIGAPCVKGAVFKLSNGKTLETEVGNAGGVYVKSVEFNGEKIDNYRISVEKIMNGGKLVFEMQ